MSHQHIHSHTQGSLGGDQNNVLPPPLWTWFWEGPEKISAVGPEILATSLVTPLCFLLCSYSWSLHIDQRGTSCPCVRFLAWTKVKQTCSTIIETWDHGSITTWPSNTSSLYSISIISMLYSFYFIFIIKREKKLATCAVLDHPGPVTSLVALLLVCLLLLFSFVSHFG